VDPYQQLGLAPNATIDEAEDAYHRLLRRHHPDLHHAGTPDEIAEAARHTRALNEAIDQIRSGYESVSAAAPGATSSTTHAGPRWGRAEPGQTAWGSTWDPGGSNADTRATADAAGTDWYDTYAGHPGNAFFGEPPATATPCPLCGAWFSRRDHLTMHVKQVHHLRLEHEPRPSRFRRSFLGSRLAGLRHLSLWVLVPFNALVAAMLATLVAGNIDAQMSYWVFAVAMSPTFIRLLDRTDPEL
jgi:hypothetical protein